MTNSYPDLLSWKIVNTDINRQVISSSLSLQPNVLYDQSKCLQYGRYKFTLSYDMNDTSSNDISYSLEASNMVIDRYESNNYLDIEEYFTICSSDADCLDYDGCTIDFCTETNICENKEIETNLTYVDLNSN